MKEDIDDELFCIDCRHHEQIYVEHDHWHGCRRESIKVKDVVTGLEYYCPDKIFDCESERCQTKSIREYIFGERPGKCGRKGQYFSEKVV